MLADPRPSWRTQIRAYLATDRIAHLEALMSSVLESLQALAEQQRAASAAQLTSFANLQGAVQRLETAVREGQVSPDVQAAVDDLKRGFDTMLETAGRADDGYEPQPETPAEGGTDVPPAEDGTDTPPATDTPATENPEVPAEGDGTGDTGVSTTRRSR